MSDRTMEVLPLPRCCPTPRGLRLRTLIPNKCTQLRQFTATSIVADEFAHWQDPRAAYKFERLPPETWAEWGREVS